MPKMKKIVEPNGADEGAKLIGEMQTGSLEEDATATFNFPIQRGKTYWVYAACGGAMTSTSRARTSAATCWTPTTKKDDVDPVLLVSDRYATQLK